MVSQHRAHRRVGLAGGEDITVASEDLLDEVRGGQHDDVAKSVRTDREHISIAVPAAVHQRNGPRCPPNRLRRSRPPRSGRHSVNGILLAGGSRLLGWTGGRHVNAPLASNQSVRTYNTDVRLHVKLECIYDPGE